MAQKTRGRHNAAKLKKIAKHAKQLIAREGPVMFMGVSIFSGALAFSEIVKASWDIPEVSLQRIVLAITIMKLPAVFARLKDSNDPYLICFAKGFYDGFLGIELIAPSVVQCIIGLRKFVLILKEPKEA